MSESLFKKFMVVMYVVILGIFGWVIYKAPDEWLQVVCLVVVATPVYFLIVRFACNTSRRYGGFSPEAEGRMAKSAPSPADPSPKIDSASPVPVRVVSRPQPVD